MNDDYNVLVLEYYNYFSNPNTYNSLNATKI